MTGARPDFFNGLNHFASEFVNAVPSWLVILLGTNDLRSIVRKEAKNRTRMDANVVAQNCASIALKAIDIHKHSGFFPKDSELKIVIVAPPCVKLCGLSETLGYDETSYKIAQGFNEAYRTMCETHGFKFVPSYVDASKSMDGIHFTEGANRQVAFSVLNEIYRELRPDLVREIKIPQEELEPMKVKNIQPTCSFDEHFKKRRKAKDFDEFFFIHGRRKRYEEDELSSDSESLPDKKLRYLSETQKELIIRLEIGRAHV